MFIWVPENELNAYLPVCVEDFVVLKFSASHSSQAVPLPPTPFPRLVKLRRLEQAVP